MAAQEMVNARGFRSGISGAVRGRPVRHRHETLLRRHPPALERTPTATGPPPATRVAVVAASDLEFRVVNASLAPSFGPPLDLASLDDERSYLLVSVAIRNTGSAETLDSEDFDVLVDGVRVNEAGDVVDAAAEGLGLKSMGDMLCTRLDGGDAETFVFAYKVAPAAGSYLLSLDVADGRTVDLAPYLVQRGDVAALRTTATPVPTATQTLAARPTRTPRPRPSATATPSLPAGVSADAAWAEVVSATDGDTTKVRVGGKTETVRLLLIDTPETKDPNDPAECYGAETTLRTKDLLLAGTTVYLEKDVTERDRYDRLLRYVWLPGEDGRRAALVNERLVRDGYVVLTTFPPDVEHLERIERAADRARDEQAGLWAACGGADTPLEPTPAPLPTQAPLATDCLGFATFEEANTYYQANPAAQPDIDPNLDGRACEVHFGIDAQSVPGAPPAADSGGTYFDSDGCTYTNVDGVQVSSLVEAPVAPPGATAKCRDGTWSFSQNRQGTRSHHGGVEYWL